MALARHIKDDIQCFDTFDTLNYNLYSGGKVDHDCKRFGLYYQNTD